MADTFVKNPVLYKGTKAQIEAAAIGSNDFAVATDVRFYNATETDTLLASKQPIGDYATNGALTSGLATKQPIGDYATNEALSSGLATKQPIGDYATNGALTSGLALKVAIAQGVENSGCLLGVNSDGNVTPVDDLKVVDGVLTWGGNNVLVNSTPYNGSIKLITNTISTGAVLLLSGDSASDGSFELRANYVSGSGGHTLRGESDGTLTWGEQNVAMHPDVKTISATSGTVTLESNKVYKMTIDGATTFSLPTSVTADIFNQIEVQIQMTSAQTIALGTSVYFTGEAPNLSQAGAYTLIYEYDAVNSCWAVGGITKA